MAKRRGPRAWIFDIDGTLVDSNDIHATAWQEAFAEFGRKIDYDDIRGMIGKGGDLLVPDLLNAREMQTFGEKIKSYRKKLFKKKYMKSVEPFPGVREAFETLREEGAKIALASSAEPSEVDHYIELLEVEDLVDAHTSKEDAQFSKPSPEIFDAARERLGISVKHAITVGDTPYDVAASHRAKIASAAVLSGGFPRKTLLKAEFIFRDLKDLVRRRGDIADYFRQ
jgi:HAD superfamily hydrolase (TIGR01549 family)